MFSKKMFIPALTGLLLTQSAFGWFGSSDGHNNVQFSATFGNGSTITQTMFGNNMVNSSASFYGQGISFVTINGKQYFARGKNINFINGQPYVNNKKVNESDIKSIKQTGKTFSTKINPEVTSADVPSTVAHVHLDPAHTGEVICDEGVKDIFTFSNIDGKLTFDMPEGIYSSNFTTTPCKILARLSTKNVFSSEGQSNVVISNSEIKKLSARGSSRIEALLNNRFSQDARIISSGASHISSDHTGEKTNRVTVVSDGASKMRIKNILAMTLKTHISGASDIKVDGLVESHKNESSGASKLDAHALKTDFTSVDASGASEVLINAEKNITGDASGCSSVRYSGNARNFIEKSGAASVKRK